MRAGVQKIHGLVYGVYEESTHLDFEAIEHSAALGRVELGAGARQQGREDVAEVAVHLDPCGLQGRVLLNIQLLDHTLRDTDTTG